MQTHQTFLNLGATIDRLADSSQVVELTLDPVVDVYEAVAHVRGQVGHALLEAIVFWVVQDQSARLHLYVVREVQVLVELKNLLHTLVGRDAVGLVGKKLGEIDLQVCEERLGLFHEEVKLNDAVGELFTLGDIVGVFVDSGSLLYALVGLADRKLWQAFEPFLDVGALWAGERPKLDRVDDIVEFRDAAEESLEVVAALLDENEVLVAEVLLGRNRRDRNAWPSLNQRFVKEVELVVATLSLKQALFVLARDFVEDSSAGVDGVTDGELITVLIERVSLWIIDLGIVEDLVFSVLHKLLLLRCVCFHHILPN